MYNRNHPHDRDIVGLADDPADYGVQRGQARAQRSNNAYHLSGDGLSPGNFRILTIGTPDGFTASFSLTEELSQELGEAHLNGVGLRAKTH